MSDELLALWAVGFVVALLGQLVMLARCEDDELRAAMSSAAGLVTILIISVMWPAASAWAIYSEIVGRLR